ncbi:MAG: hypothetical protein K2X03_06530 [Bryobacteraceae bacterium]|nr:hypothetical protein [Bryobacteraceae bacterium]
MPIFYRGASIGTYWHQHDARRTGFRAHFPGAGRSQQVSRLVHHIARGTTISPFVSLTRSYGIACGYALAGEKLPTAAQPAYVYQIEIEEQDGFGTKLLDPVSVIGRQLQPPYEWKSYHHDGEASFLLGVIDPVGHAREVQRPALFPPGGKPTPRAPQLHAETRSLGAGPARCRDSGRGRGRQGSSSKSLGDLLTMDQPIRMNYEAREIRLPKGLGDGEVVFVGATVFDEPPLPFAIVNYERAGKLQEKGLRMDLHKRVFLDHFEDTVLEQALAKSGASVAVAIGVARREYAAKSASN